MAVPRTGAFPCALLTTAIHTGHQLRPEIADRVALTDAARLREEDPFTDQIADIGAETLAVHRSRFEVDLNRPRDRAVYQTPDMAWGLDVWDEPLADEVVERSLAFHDRFYAALAARLDRLVEEHPTFLVLDVHSYNHRRDGADQPPAPAAENPVVNVGTGSLDRDRWGATVDRFVSVLGEQTAGGEPLDVRENVRFEGGHLSGWVNDRYDGRGCALAVEFKKVFMDEWTGRADDHHLVELTHALSVAATALLREGAPQ